MAVNADNEDSSISSLNAETVTAAAASTVQKRWRRRMGLDQRDASDDDHYLVVKLIDEVKYVSIARGFIKYIDLLNAGGEMMT
jgi:hypothetical protein